MSFQLKPKVCAVDGRIRLPRANRLPAPVVEESDSEESDSESDFEIEISSSEYETETEESDEE